MTRTISRELYEELSEKQDALEDEAEAISDALRIAASALRCERSSISSQVARIRRQKRGQDGGPQLEIEGAETGARKPDPLVAAILKLTAKARAAAAEDDEPPAAKNGRAKPIPGLVTSDVGAAIKHLGVRPEAGLPWRVIDGRERRADVDGGSYTIVCDLQGNWTAEWRPTAGRMKTLAMKVAETTAAEACEDHHATGRAKRAIHEAHLELGIPAPEKRDAPVTWARKGKGWEGKGGKGRRYTIEQTSTPLFASGIGYSWLLQGSGVGCGGSGPLETLRQAQMEAERREREMRDAKPEPFTRGPGRPRKTKSSKVPDEEVASSGV